MCLDGEREHLLQGQPQPVDYCEKEGGKPLLMRPQSGNEDHIRTVVEDLHSCLLDQWKGKEHVYEMAVLQESAENQETST